MATLLTFHPVEGHLGCTARNQNGHPQSCLYCPSTLQCAYASGDLEEALLALRSPLENVGAVMDAFVMEHMAVFGEERDKHGNEWVEVPYREWGNEILIVTVAQLLTVPWEKLSEDPRGKIRKGAAWAYLGALPSETQVVVHLSG